MNRPLCTHCELRVPNSTRGLCRTCTDVPGIRAMYPPLSKKSHYQVGEPPDFNGGYRLPSGPTDAPPGSPEKEAVLTERAKARVSLWHPDDYVPPCRRPF